MLEPGMTQDGLRSHNGTGYFLCGMRDDKREHGGEGNIRYEL